jgi:alpha-beta hydrolase superfamily lysophospholipase
VEHRSIRFFSEGLALDGELYVPPGLAPDERRPALVGCSGYTGLMSIHPARFARAFVPEGYVCFAFDYRGFGKSEGSRGRLVPQEQVEDVRSAVSFLETVPEVDSERLALLGWALGGGVAIAAGADDPRVGAVVAVNPVADGERSTRRLHSEDSWSRLSERLAADRRRRALEREAELVDPFEILPLDEVTREYVEDELFKTDGFGTRIALESADLLFRFRPVEAVHRLAPRPLLLVHGSANRLYLPSESEELYRRAGEPKRLELVEGGHTEWMYDDHPTFKRLVEIIREFLADALAGEPIGRR